MSSTEQIKERLPIEELISSYISLERAGKSLRAKCPFHTEKTPSFYVSPDRNTYYCFGCGAKGDIFTFVQEFEGLDFKGALKMLADRTGVKLENFDNEKSDEKDLIFRIMDEAKKYYHSEIKKHPNVIEYLTSRGMTKKTIDEWEIGFAPEGWRSILQHLSSKKYSETLIEKTGLIKKADNKENGNQTRYYDRFRSRIMFPIFDSSGRVVAFSGRIFGVETDEAKYINSPETAIYSKSKILYGFDRAKQGIRKMKFTILVEGQVDLVLSHQTGFTNTVALSGTALTQNHLALLKRLSQNSMLAFDGDEGGKRATLKNGAIALSENFTVKVAELLDEKDPSDIVIESKEKWKEILKSAKHLIEYHLEEILKKEKDERKKIVNVEKEILPYITLLESPAERDFFMDLVSKKSGIKRSALEEKIESLKGKMPIDISEDRKEKNSPSDPQKKLIGIIRWQKGMTKQDIDLENIKKRIFEIVGNDFWKNATDKTNMDWEESAFEAERLFGDSKDLELDVEDLLLRFEEDYLRSEMQRIKMEQQKAEEMNDDKRNEILIKEIQNLTKKRNELEKRKIK